MQYKEIVSITGLSGLYHLITNKGDGAIVRSLEDNTTKFVSSRNHNLTPLETIEVFTTGDNVKLEELFKAMERKETEVSLPAANTSDPKILKAYFDKVYPELDNEKVYVSDKKKMVKWYAILKEHDLLKFEEEKPEEDEITEDKKPKEDNKDKSIGKKTDDIDIKDKEEAEKEKKKSTSSKPKMKVAPKGKTEDKPKKETKMAKETKSPPKKITSKVKK